MKEVDDILYRHADRLMRLPGVFHVAIGCEKNRPCIEILADQVTDDLRRRAPLKVEGVPVRIRQKERPGLS